jgi:hypothetical protein
LAHVIGNKGADFFGWMVTRHGALRAPTGIDENGREWG